jgi:aryl-alcohol dehydrogenase
MQPGVAGSSRKFTGAVVREKGGKFLIEELTLAAPHPDEVVVQVCAVGLCHTDIVVRDQYYHVPLPSVLGHEGSGTIVEVGSAVRNLSVGDRVALTYLSCGQCRLCEGGEPSYCENFFPLNFSGGRPDTTTATKDRNGAPVHDHFFGQSSFGTYAIANHRNCVKLSREVPLELVGPLGCGIQTGAGAVLNALRLQPGTSIAVFGAGAVGLSAVMAARVAGATTIIAVDVIDSRLTLAKELGATHVINTMRTDPVKEGQAIAAGGVRYSIETSGLPKVIRQAVDILGIRGECGIIGASPLGTEAAFDTNSHLAMGKSVRGIVEGDSRPDSFIPHLIDLYLRGDFPFDRLVTYYPLSQINEAIEASLSGSTIKAILRMP